MSAILSNRSVAATQRSSARERLRAPVVLRFVLLVGLVAVVVVAAVVRSPSAATVADAKLVSLLRGMALIKAGIALVAVALAAWRFGRPIPSAVAFGYLVGAWCLAGAAVLIWQLSFIPAAAVIFHVGMLGLLALAWREGRFESRMRSV